MPIMGWCVANKRWHFSRFKPKFCTVIKGGRGEGGGGGYMEHIIDKCVILTKFSYRNDIQKRV